MMSVRWRRMAAIVGISALGIGFSPPYAEAIIVLGINGRNSYEPTGDLANSGWQYQGNWQSGLGTAIAPNAFLTARHSGGSVGDPFVYQGRTYQTSEIIDSPHNDLRIVKVEGDFAAFAPLYSRSDELGRDLVAYGRGPERGIELFVGNTTAGWLLGRADGERSWGANNVSALYADDGQTGDLLGFEFNETGGVNESILTPGDSGGGLFIQDVDGQWKLAGVNYGVTGPYKTSSDPNAAVFDAALYDRLDLLQRESDGTFTLQSGADPLPGISSASRVSSNLDFIRNAVGIDLLAEDLPLNPTNPLISGSTSAPEPASVLLLAAGGILVLGLATWRKRQQPASSSPSSPLPNA